MPFPGSEQGACQDRFELAGMEDDDCVENSRTPQEGHGALLVSCLHTHSKPSGILRQSDLLPLTDRSLKCIGADQFGLAAEARTLRKLKEGALTDPVGTFDHVEFVETLPDNLAHGCTTSDDTAAKGSQCGRSRDTADTIAWHTTWREDAPSSQTPGQPDADRLEDIPWCRPRNASLHLLT